MAALAASCIGEANSFLTHAATLDAIAMTHMPDVPNPTRRAVKEVGTLATGLEGVRDDQRPDLNL